MANPDKRVVPGKVEKDKNSNRKFKVKKDKDHEVDVDIDILDDGEYEVDKLETDRLPTTMPDGSAIRWYNNFSIKKNGEYINQRYRVTVPGLSSKTGSRLVIFNGNGDLYYYEGIVDNDTFELTNGDPGIGGSPP